MEEGGSFPQFSQQEEEGTTGGAEAQRATTPSHPATLRSARRDDGEQFKEEAPDAKQNTGAARINTPAAGIRSWINSRLSQSNSRLTSHSQISPRSLQDPFESFSIVNSDDPFP